MPQESGKTSAYGREMANDLKSWAMIALTFIFVLLYVAALTGYLKPLEKMDMLTRLEPIIFVIIGYYFGRLPAQQNEKTLKDEINRQQQKADAAQQIKEKVLQEREALEEKIKNATSVIATMEPAIESINRMNESSDLEQNRYDRKTVSSSLNIVRRILNS